MLYKNFTAFISIHALLAESDPFSGHFGRAALYFYPRSPCGERPRSDPAPRAQKVFLSTLSLRRATTKAEYFDTAMTHFYPRSPCGERLAMHMPGNTSRHISIHALLAESDRRKPLLQYAIPKFLSTLSLRRATNTACSKIIPLSNFYPRSPCGERRNTELPDRYRNWISIHALLAESDFGLQLGYTRIGYFYPRSPCGERHTV